MWKSSKLRQCTLTNSVIVSQLLFMFASLSLFVLLSFTLSRNSLNEITVVVWRTGPSVKTKFEGLIHHPSYNSYNYDTPVSPAKVKRGEKTPPLPPLPAHHRTSRRTVVNSSEGVGRGGSGAGILWGERRTAVDSKTSTQTLRGTRVKASNGENYIILSPVNPGSQVDKSIVRHEQYGDQHMGSSGCLMSQYDVQF